MYSYTYHGQTRYIATNDPEQIMAVRNKQNFKLFEWNSVPNPTGVGLSTEVRMVFPIVTDWSRG